MSFDMWVEVCGEDNLNTGVSPTVSVRLIEKTFLHLQVIKYSEESWLMQYGDDSSFTFGLPHDSPGRTGGFYFSNPPSTPKFWGDLAYLLRVLPLVLHWPGGGCVVGKKSTALLVPKLMTDNIGTPVIVENGSDILKWMDYWNEHPPMNKRSE